MTPTNRTGTSQGVSTSRRTTKLKARSYSKKAASFLLALVVAINLSFGSGFTALAEEVNKTVDPSVTTQTEESSSVESSSQASEEAPATPAVPAAPAVKAPVPAPIAPQSEDDEGGIMPMAVNTQNLTVFKSDGHTSLITSGGTGSWVMTDESNIIVSGEFQTDTGNASARTATITLPDTYVWDGTPASTVQFTVSVVDTHTLKITFPAPANPSQPETIGFSFKAKLDKTSVSDAHWTAMQTGAWDINGNNGQDNNTKFTFVMDDDASTVTDTATFTFKNPAAPGASWWIDPEDAHFYRHDQGISVKMVDTASDMYTYGPIVPETLTLTVPAGLHFDDAIYANAFDGSTHTISPDGRTITFTITDSSSFSRAFYAPKSVMVVPDDSYVTVDNVNDDRFMPGQTISLAGSLSYKDNFRAQDSLSADFKISDYVLGETGSVVAEGTPDRTDGDKLVVVQLPANSSSTISVGATVGRPEIPMTNDSFGSATEPKNNGEGYSVSVTYDPNIKVKDTRAAVKKHTQTKYGTTLTDTQVREVTYYTVNHPEGITKPAASLDDSCTISAESGDYITGYTVVYDTLAYGWTGQGAAQLDSNAHFEIGNGQPGDKFPITYTMKDASSTTVTTATQYIMIEKEKCPTIDFAFDVNTEATKAWIETAGNYTTDGYDAGSFTLKLKDAEVGGTSGIKSSVENPIFKLESDYGQGLMSAWGRGVYASGVIDLNAVMGDGNWTITVSTMTAAAEQAAIPSSATPTTHTLTIPAFSTDTSIDLYSASQFGSDALSSDEYIVGEALLKHTGTFDYSALSGATTDKTFFSVNYKSYALDPLTGYYTDGNGSIDGFYSLSYDDCTCIDLKHMTEVDGAPNTKLTHTATYGNDFYAKGADAITAQSSVTTYTGTLVQGETTTITADIALNAVSSPNAQLWSKGGEVAYFKLAQQSYASFVPGSATFNGVSDPDAAIVTIDGAKYLKVTNKAAAKQLMEQSRASNNYVKYDPFEITFDVYCLPTTPVTGPLTFIEQPNLNRQSSWLDIAPSDENTTGNIFSAVKASSNQLGSYMWPIGCSGDNAAGGTGYNRYYNQMIPTLYDDPLNLHGGTTDSKWGGSLDLTRDWAMGIAPLSITPQVSAVQGITLNPGISNSYQNDYQTVKPAEEGSMTTAISIIAGTTDMSGLDSVIKIPRAGDTLTKYPGNTTTVSQYLTGPAVEVSGPGNGASAPVTFEYSTDGGATFVDEASISDWSTVTHIHVHNNLMKAQDTASYYLPLETENAKDDTGVGSAGTGTNAGKSYWEAVFTTDTLEAKSNRMNTYDYGHLSIAGTVFNDADGDGNNTGADSAASGVAVELWADEAGVSKKVGDATTGSDGTYNFNTDYYQNVVVKVVTPNGKKITVYSATKDNKFPANGTGTVAVTPGVIPATLTADITGIDAGLVPGPLIVELEGVKTITGTGAEAKTYNFTMADGNASGTTGYTMPSDLTASAANVAVGTPVDFKFDGIEITAPGTYTFTFTEDDLTATDVAAGYTKDDATVTATVVVGKTAGEWTVNVTYAGGAGTKNNTLENTYMVPEVTGHPAIIKATNTSAATPGSYPNVTFTMADTTDYTETGAPEAAATMPATKTVAVQSAAEDVTGQFQDITFTKTGTYTFSITETAGTGSGWTASSAVTATATVSIVNGALSVAWAYDNDDTITNTYAVTDATAGLTINKAAAGDTPKAYPTFTFSVAEGSGNDTSGYTMPATTTASVQAAATAQAATFDNITFTKAGSYTFDITETTADANGWVKDGNTVTATVVVTDTAGALGANVTYSGGTGTDHNTITNTFTKVDATMSVTKHVAGQTPPSYPVFSFTLANTAGDTDGFTMPTSATTTVQSAVSDASGNFGAVSFYKAGTYTFTGTETTADANGWVKSDSPVTYTVVVTDTNGVLAIDTDASTLTGTITNTYTPEEAGAALTVTKAYAGQTSTGTPTWNFSVAEGSGNDTTGYTMPADTTASVTGAGQATFDEITFTKAGTYTFKITETTADTDNWVKDGNTITATVVVTDTAGVLGTNVTYDNNDTITNTYTATPTLPTDENTKLSITKAVEGAGAPSAQTFEFTLATTAAAADVTLPATTVLTKPAGSVDFDAITFKKAGTYTFTITETAPTAAGWSIKTGTTGVVTATIVVTDNAGQLEAGAPSYTQNATITNQYDVTATTLAIPVVKTISSDSDTPATAETFNFAVALDSANPTAGVTMPATTTTSTSGAGTASFDAITFTQAGTYVFKVTETAGSTAGYIYSTDEVTVTVVVEDQSSVLTKTSVTYAGGKNAGDATTGKAGFENKYQIPILALTKDVDLAKATPGTQLSYSIDVTNTGHAAGTNVVVTDTLPAYLIDATDISDGGTYNAGAGTITWTLPSIDAVTGTKTLTFKATIDPDNADMTKDNISGTPGVEVINSASVGDSTDTATTKVVWWGETTGFDDIAQDPPIQKIISGDTPAEAAEFEFTMTGLSGAPMPFAGTYTAADGTQTTTVLDAATNTLTAAHAGAGGVEFGEISYDTPGTYSYTLAESNTGVQGYDYDSNTYTMVVVITNNGGHLEKAVTYTDARGTAVQSMDYVNNYDGPDVSVVKTADKTQAKPGEEVTYTITVTNNGGDSATGVWTKDNVPENTTFVSCDAKGSHESSRGQEYVTWFEPTLAIGASVTYTMTVSVNECQDGTGITNVALFEVTNKTTRPTDTTMNPSNTSNEAVFTVTGNGNVAAKTIQTATSKLVKTGDEAILLICILSMVMLASAAGAYGLRRRRQN